jgi:hypothetical protein
VVPKDCEVGDGEGVGGGDTGRGETERGRPAVAVGVKRVLETRQEVVRVRNCRLEGQCQ